MYIVCCNMCRSVFKRIPYDAKAMAGKEYEIADVRIQ